jgi:nucleoside recognition membrane protein YjiH
MFLPALIFGGGTNMTAMFVIGVVSVSQLIFMSETGAVILKTKLGITFPKLFVTFLIRTAIALPIALLAAALFGI